MKITILFFASLKEIVGTAEDTYNLEPGTTPEQAATRILGFHTNIVYAINDNLANKDATLQDGDRLAFIPPMAGG